MFPLPRYLIWSFRSFNLILVASFLLPALRKMRQCYRIIDQNSFHNLNNQTTSRRRNTLIGTYGKKSYKIVFRTAEIVLRPNENEWMYEWWSRKSNTFERDENFFSSTKSACGHVKCIFIDNDFFYLNLLLNSIEIDKVLLWRILLNEQFHFFRDLYRSGTC